MTLTIVMEALLISGALLLIAMAFAGVLILGLMGIKAYLDHRESLRRSFLKQFVFPERCYVAVQDRYPHLSDQQVSQAFEQLRMYFEVCLEYSSANASHPVAMPSKLVDVCWHAFICDTKVYQAFCKAVFGGFFQHASMPNSSFGFKSWQVQDDSPGTNKDAVNQRSAAQVYQWARSLEQGRDSTQAVGAPFLFLIDQAFKIEDGYFYDSEVLAFLAYFDLKASSKLIDKNETLATSSVATCGDGGGICGGCGGSV